MTHTLHRQGNRESLSNDYVIFAIAAQGINAQGSEPKFARFWEIVSRHNPINGGDMRTGNVITKGSDAIAGGVTYNSIVHAVFTDKKDIIECLRELKEADLGLSIVVSGLLDEVDKCCQAAGLRRHTVEHSLGVHGNTTRLPSDPRVLEISTMCGHGMVAFSLINHMVNEIRAGRTTPMEAARELARQCQCGVVNTVRAADVLREMV